MQDTLNIEFQGNIDDSGPIVPDSSLPSEQSQAGPEADQDHEHT